MLSPCTTILPAVIIVEAETAPVAPATDCTGAAAAACDVFTKPEGLLVKYNPAELKVAVVTVPVNPATDCIGAAAAACDVFTKPEGLLVKYNPAELKFAVVTVPVNPSTDCTGAAAAAPLEFTNPLSLVKLLSVILLVFILSAVSVPVIILPPSIVVVPEEPKDKELPLPSSIEFVPVKVTSPVNPIPWTEDEKLKLLPEDVSPPAVFSSALKYEYQYLFVFPAAKVGGVVAQPLVNPEKLFVLK